MMGGGGKRQLSKSFDQLSYERKELAGDGILGVIIMGGNRPSMHSCGPGRKKKRSSRIILPKLDKGRGARLGKRGRRGLSIPGSLTNGAEQPGTLAKRKNHEAWKIISR